MNRNKLLYLVWLLPAFFVGLIIHQTMVYYSITNTYENGESYTAEIIDFEFKQIASQTNGYIELQFTTQDQEQVHKQLSLPIEMAGELQKSRVLPIRYHPDTFQEVVIMTTFEIQKGLAWTNVGMASVALLITVFIAGFTHRYARRLIKEGEEEFIVERIDA